MKHLLVALLLSAPAFGQADPAVGRAETRVKQTQPVPVVIDVHVVITITVDVTPGPTPPPGPGPNPPPPSPNPPPTDPLTQALVDAANKDGGKFDQFGKLATGFTNCAKAANTASTASALQAQLTATLATDVGAGTITPAVRAVLEDQLKPLDTLLPVSQPNKSITDPIRATVLDLFNKLAAACTAAGKASK